ncbi:GroES-like protein [Phaeosphaeriaceae sp. SRC1lsM3a]|nr:GroES-like protein [Stagonospora sp. SRC1lsM3a]
MSTVKAAIVNEWGAIPQYAEMPAPANPTADEVQIRVIAAGTHRLVRARAAGKHFSATTLPHIPGSDGVGRTIPDNKLVYFTTFWQKGSFVEVVNVAKREVTPIPEESDPVQIAGLANPALSSWMAIKARTSNLPEKFSVLVLGATTTSGAVSSHIARMLGAGKVIGVARNVKAMEALGYDEVVELKSDPAETDYSSAEDVDLILDYIYGPPTLQLFKTLKPTKPVQYVQIGTLASPTMDLPGDLIRAKDITMRGAAPGSYSMQILAQELPKMLEALKDLPKQDLKVVPLSEVQTQWPNEKNRLVFTVGKNGN